MGKLRREATLSFAFFASLPIGVNTENKKKMFIVALVLSFVSTHSGKNLLLSEQIPPLRVDLSEKTRKTNKKSQVVTLC